MKKFLISITQILIVMSMLFINVETNNVLASTINVPLVDYDLLALEYITTTTLDEEITIAEVYVEDFELPEHSTAVVPFVPVVPDTPPVNHRDTCFSDEYNMYDHNPLTGFVDDWGFCVPGLVTTKVWFTRSPRYVYGTAVWYAPGLMRATAKWRSIEMFDLAYRSDEYLGGVAVPSPANIGDTVWLRRSGREWEGPYLVVDCSRRADMYTHIAINQQVVEVDFETALAWGLVRGNYDDWEMVSGREQTVEVWYGVEKPDDDILNTRQPVYFSTYWLYNVAEFQREAIEPAPIFYQNGLNPLWDLRDGNGKQCFTYSCLTGEE